MPRPDASAVAAAAAAATNESGLDGKRTSDIGCQTSGLRLRRSRHSVNVGEGN
jgi:hypothetical protein